MKTILWFVHKYSKDDVSAHSAQVSFFIVISLFPFVLFLLSLLQFTPLTKDIILQVIERVAPNSLNTQVQALLDEIYSISSSKALLSISVIGTLWAGSKGFLGLNNGIQKIYSVNDKRNYIKIRILAMTYMVAFALMIAATLLVLVYGNKIYLFLSNHVPFINDVAILAFAFRATLGLGILFWFFVILYTAIPAKSIRMRDQMPGAFITSVLWIAFSFLYSYYIDNFANMASLYGSLTYIVIFMLWLFFSMNFVFVGAEINVFYTLNKASKKKQKDNNEQ